LQLLISLNWKRSTVKGASINRTSCFDDIEATKVVLRNTKLYVNREEGLGTSLKKDEYLTDCSDIDDVIVFLRDGNMMVTKVDTKTFVGKDIIYCYIWQRDKRTTYNLIYRDGKSGPSYIKDLMFRVLPEINYMI
jgi:topoisomerase-4 subunit A